MNCLKIHEKLIFYLEGSLSVEDANAISLHLDDCKECSKLLQHLSDNLTYIEVEKKIQPSPYLYTRLIAKLEKAQLQELRINLNKRILQPILIFLIVICTAFAGIKLGGIYKMTSKKEIANIDAYYWDDLSQEIIENTLLNEN